MTIQNISRHLDIKMNCFSRKYGSMLLATSIGLIYVWFGVLKFFPGISPAENLAADTMAVLTFQLIDNTILLWMLALGEVAIGLCLMARVKSRILVWALLFHMAGTLTPIFIFPELVFHHPPFGFSIIGQYIMKNFVIISAALVLYNKNR